MNIAEGSKPRVYDAGKRAAANGEVNQDAERAEKELRERIAFKTGQPYSVKSGEAKGLNPGFYSCLYSETHPIVYDGEDGGFYIYETETGVWSPPQEEILLKDVREFMAAESRKLDILLVSRPATFDREFIHYLKSYASRPGFFAHDAEGIQRINLVNGVLELTDEGETFHKTFSMEHRCRHKIPLVYDASVTDKPLFDVFLGGRLSLDDILVVQQVFGLNLTGVNYSERFVKAYGPQGSGKGTLLDVLMAVVGEHNTAVIDTNDMKGTTAFEGYKDAKLLQQGDASENFFTNSGAHHIKNLTGRGRMKEQIKFKKSVYFKGNKNMWINGNYEPNFGDKDVCGAGRRAILLPFKSGPLHDGKVTPDYGKDLVEQEGSAILNWALEGLRMLRRNEFRFQETEEQKQRLELVLDKSKRVFEFVMDCVTVQRGEYLTMDQLLNKYGNYCHMRKWERVGMSAEKKQIRHAMEKLFGRKDDSNSCPGDDGKNKQGFRGVRFILPDDDDEADSEA